MSQKDSYSVRVSNGTEVARFGNLLEAQAHAQMHAKAGRREYKIVHLIEREIGSYEPQIVFTPATNKD